MAFPGSSTPLGELFDHGLDAWSCLFLPLALYSVFGRSEVYSGKTESRLTLANVNLGTANHDVLSISRFCSVPIVVLLHRLRYLFSILYKSLGKVQHRSFVSSLGLRF